MHFCVKKYKSYSFESTRHSCFIFIIAKSSLSDIVVDQDSLNPDPDPVFQVNPDSDCESGYESKDPIESGSNPYPQHWSQIQIGLRSIGSTDQDQGRPKGENIFGHESLKYRSSRFNNKPTKDSDPDSLNFVPEHCWIGMVYWHYSLCLVRPPDDAYIPYMIHVAMSPVLHVEGCRTLLGSVVIHHQLSGSLVCMSSRLSTCPLYFMPSLFRNFLFLSCITAQVQLPGSGAAWSRHPCGRTKGRLGPDPIQPCLYNCLPAR